MVTLRDSLYNNALFGMVIHHDPWFTTFCGRIPVFLWNCPGLDGCLPRSSCYGKWVEDGQWGKEGRKERRMDGDVSRSQLGVVTFWLYTYNFTHFKDMFKYMFQTKVYTNFIVTYSWLISIYFNIQRLHLSFFHLQNPRVSEKRHRSFAPFRSRISTNSTHLGARALRWARRWCNDTGFRRGFASWPVGSEMVFWVHCCYYRDWERSEWCWRRDIDMRVGDYDMFEISTIHIYVDIPMYT